MENKERVTKPSKEELQKIIKSRNKQLRDKEVINK